MKNYLTIDVEDYYHVSAFENIVDYRSWDSYESRVIGSTRRLLDLLAAEGDVKATFFILGWIAEKHPEIVKEIDAAGHEIACHSYRHRCIYNMTPEEFREDTRRAKSTLENIISREVIGYRAPSYSITDASMWAFDILEEAGFKYDSSVFPILHDRYGIPNAPRFSYKPKGYNIMEYPISTYRFMGTNLPVSGGGYFRFFPFQITKACLKSINRRERQPFVFYIHPWEIDPEQPRMRDITFASSFRHYLNLNKTESRLEKLLKSFSFGPLADI